MVTFHKVVLQVEGSMLSTVLETVDDEKVVVLDCHLSSSERTPVRRRNAHPRHIGNERSVDVLFNHMKKLNRPVSVTELKLWWTSHTKFAVNGLSARLSDLEQQDYVHRDGDNVWTVTPLGMQTEYPKTPSAPRKRR